MRKRGRERERAQRVEDAEAVACKIRLEAWALEEDTGEELFWYVYRNQNATRTNMRLCSVCKIVEMSYITFCYIAL